MPNSQFSIVNSQFTLTPNPLWLALASMPYLQELKNPSTLYLANTLAADLMSQSVFKTYPQLREKIAEALKTESSISQFPSPYSQINKSTNQQLFSNPEALETRIDENLDKLVNSHHPDGGWSRMPEQGESSVYVTRSILETLHIPINNSTNQQFNSSTVCNALRYIDGQMEMLHRDTLAPQLNNSTSLSTSIFAQSIPSTTPFRIPPSTTGTPGSRTNFHFTIYTLHSTLLRPSCPNLLPQWRHCNSPGTGAPT